MFSPTILRLAAPLFLAACSTPEAMIDTEDFADIVEERLKMHDVPGAYVAVVADGDIVFEHAAGTEELNGQTAFTADTRGRLASATKVLSGLTFLSMAEDGLLDLEGTLGDLDPSLPEAFRPLPVWRILNHTSGLPMVVTRPEFRNMDQAEMMAMTADDVLELIADEPLDFAPGEGWHYQQSGYALLAHALEKKTGASFEDLIAEHVLRPARMTDTSYATPERTAPAYGGENGALTYQPGIYARPLLSAGGYDTTGRDLTRLIAALDDGRIVSPGFLEQEVRQQERLYRTGRDVEGEGYGLATIVSLYGQTWTIGHSGGGGLADIRYAPGEDLGIVVLTNRAGGTGVASEITTLLSEELFGPSQRTE